MTATAKHGYPVYTPAEEMAMLRPAVRRAQLLLLIRGQVLDPGVRIKAVLGFHMLEKLEPSRARHALALAEAGRTDIALHLARYYNRKVAERPQLAERWPFTPPPAVEEDWP